MICSKCGADVAEGKAFCSNCGQRMTAATMNSAPTESENAAPKPAKKKSGVRERSVTVREGKLPFPYRKYGIVGGILIFIFGIIWAIAGDLPVIGDFPLAEAVFEDEPLLAEHVPASADGYITLNIAEGNANWQQATQLFEQAEQDHENFSLLVESLSTRSLSWSLDIRPWIGEQATIFFDFDQEIRPENETFALAAVAPVQSSEHADIFWQDLEQNTDLVVQSETYLNVPLLTIQDQADTPWLLDSNSLLGSVDQAVSTSSYWAYSETHLLVSNSRTLLERSIDAAQGEVGRLVERTSWQAAQFEPDEMPWLDIYVDFQPLAEQVSPQGQLMLASLIGDPQQFLYQVLNEELDTLPLIEGRFQANYWRSIGLWHGTVALQNDGWQLQWQSEGWPYQTNLSLESPPIFSPVLADELPASPILLAEGEELETWLNNLLFNPSLSLGELLNLGLVEPLSQSPSANLDLPDDLVDWLPGNFVLGAWQTNEFPVLALVAELEDFSKVEEPLQRTIVALDSLANGDLTLGQDLSTEEVNARFSKQTVGSVDAWVYQLEESVVGSRLSFAAVGDNLIISSDLTGIEAFMLVEQGEAESLLSQSKFLELFNQLEPPVEYYGYVEFQPSWQLWQQSNIGLSGDESNRQSSIETLLNTFWQMADNAILSRTPDSSNSQWNGWMEGNFRENP